MFHPKNPVIWLGHPILDLEEKPTFGSGMSGQPAMFDDCHAGTKTAPIHQSGDCRPRHKNYRFMLEDAECMHSIAFIIPMKVTVGV